MPPPPPGTVIVRWIAAPDICLGGILRQLASVVRHHPTWSPSSLAATERDHQRLRATRLGGQCQGRSLYLKVTIEATTVYVKAVDQNRIELLLGQVRYIETEEAIGRAANAVFVAPTHDVERARA
jgi:hypothetical protein